MAVHIIIAISILDIILNIPGGSSPRLPQQVGRAFHAHRGANLPR